MVGGGGNVASSTNAMMDVNYRGPVEMSGWVQKFQSRVRNRQVKRYFRLNNSMLSNHPQLTGPATWEVSVSKCIVKTNDARCQITMRLIDREIRFQLATVPEMERWSAAIRSASVCNIEDFYRLGEQLGFGSFGAVLLAYDLVSGEKRAVKIVERTSNAKELEFVQREINVLLSISHPNIVRTYDIFDERDKIHLVMDYVRGGDFFDYMAKRSALNEFETKVIIWQMFKGIGYLHANNIVHRDIKPENMLVVQDNPIIIQLTDFGFANFIDPKSKQPQTDMKSMVGTGCYMPPEVIDSRGHGKPVDIFAGGVVLFRVLSGRLPFRGMTLQECYNQAVSGKADFHGKEWRSISKVGKDFCSGLLEPDPSRRPTVAQVLAHPWFTADEKFQIELERYSPTKAKKERKVQSLRNLNLMKRPFGTEGKSSLSPRGIADLAGATRSPRHMRSF